MSTIILYSHKFSPRLIYIAEFLFGRVMGASYILTDSKIEFENSNDFKINYSTELIQNAQLNIIPNGLLNEISITEQVIEVFEWNALKAFFKTSDEEVSFDILSASFLLLSRYEEYLPYQPDLYQRYPEEISTAFKHNFLQLPLIDLWAKELKHLIKHIDIAFQFEERKMKFIPTYDIDIAYSYLGKGMIRNIGGGLRDLLKADFLAFAKRMKVLFGNEKDPYDSFNWLDNMHQLYSFSPIYFFLVSEGGRLDKNIHPSHSSMNQLISSMKKKYQIGIHPSYQSHDDTTILANEIKQIGSTKSRQHYIRFQLPTTFRNLIAQGIQEDYSMGYGSINGFRASTSFDHPWFDLEKNEVTSLRLFPFCYMECNSFYEQRITSSQALDEMFHYKKIVEKVDGNLITIWHNFSLGDEPLWTGWKETYQQFLESMKSSY